MSIWFIINRFQSLQDIFLLVSVYCIFTSLYWMIVRNRYSSYLLRIILMKLKSREIDKYSFEKLYNYMYKEQNRLSQAFHVKRQENAYGNVCLYFVSQKNLTTNWLPHSFECSGVTGHWLHRAGSSIMWMGKLTITKWGDTLHCTIGTHIFFIVQNILFSWLTYCMKL